ncbi:hypothetical protein PLESTB_000915900 [Pleodorina starrii]|uniref:Thioredoxin domain-containing protein n=1 Tax=Pleodorina starrii TaxID=330485 RepID=A0A9W6F3A8_9CHLO|nr:hypothetical protein PLESTM_001526900 [Pleodorina starrii]GLC54882.1 hypothetical protein PLESTB_000915900 [Pleodorina starrii]GLC73669.1 hypothetical protein PLESTF_001406600 [Pleodorina starrii]
MWPGSPAPTRPAGGRTCTQRTDSSFLLASSWLPCAPRFPRLGPHTPRRGTGHSVGRLLFAPGAAAAAAPSGKHAVPAIVSYTVQKGETLWDVAVQHGVSMRTIKDLNKLPGSEPVLTEGQQLLVPASGITAVAAVDGATSAVALGSTPARGLWVGSEHVRLANVGEAKELYLRQCDRGNSQNTLLVLYAPWCPHCRDMEDELERLAEGLSHVSAVRVVAVDADCVEGRMFAREVLGVAYYPSIISFPAHSRTFFKYKGRQRDAESLLRFINMTCCAREDQMWALRSAGTTSSVVLVPGGKWVNQLVPVGTSPGALATAVGLLALLAGVAAAALAARRRAAAAAGGTGAGGAAVEAEVVAELDSSLGRMAALMLRAVKTRLALLLGMVGSAAEPPSPPTAAVEVTAAPPRPPPPAASSPLESERIAGAAAAQSSVSPSAAALAAQRRRAARSSGGGDSLLVPAGVPWDNEPIATTAVTLDNSRVRAAPAVTTAPVMAAATAVAVAPAAAAAVASAPLSDPSMVPGARELTAEERMRLTRLTDDELIALVNSDPDLDKVLSRLLGDK